ncbi:hypothetical protein, partial [Turicimonas muris]|uniref:hypothetical protein n=2 Tax=Turicimonas muris TaxID=1796652 RepID=UPI0025927AA0
IGKLQHLGARPVDRFALSYANARGLASYMKTFITPCRINFGMNPKAVSAPGLQNPSLPSFVWIPQPSLYV